MKTVRSIGICSICARAWKLVVLIGVITIFHSRLRKEYTTIYLPRFSETKCLLTTQCHLLDFETYDTSQVAVAGEWPMDYALTGFRNYSYGYHDYDSYDSNSNTSYWTYVTLAFSLLNSTESQCRQLWQVSSMQPPSDDYFFQVVGSSDLPAFLQCILGKTINCQEFLLLLRFHNRCISLVISRVTESLSRNSRYSYLWRYSLYVDCGAQFN